MTIARWLWLVPMAGVAAACNDQPTAPVPATLIVVQAPSPVGVPGWILLDTLKVRAVDAGGHPQSGVTVTWAVNAGGGSVAVTADTTDAEGLASAVWTLGPREGLNVVRVRTLDDASVEFRSSGEAFKVDRLASSESMGCGLVGGALWCWGVSFWGTSPPASLFATELDPPGWSSGPGRVDGATGYVDVAVSGSEVCAIDGQATAWCATPLAPGMAQIAGLPPIRGIVGAGFAYPGRFCGLAVSDSTPWCWQVGGAPAQVPGTPHLTAMWAERSFVTDFPLTACGLRGDSTAVCWGAGPLGDGTTVSSATPVVVSGLHRFVELAVGSQFACGRTALGEAWCWGAKYLPQSGTGTSVTTPTLMTAGASSIAADNLAVQLIGGAGSAARRWWGSNYLPQSPTGLTPLAVVSFSQNNLSCVRLVDGQVYCYDEMWNPGWSTIADMNYSAVQPVRPPALDVRRP